MKHFLVLYIGSTDAPAKWEATEEQRQAGMNGWMKWATDNSASIVDGGSPLGTTKRVGKNGVSDIRNRITAYTIVQAETYDTAANLFLGHPHFAIFPGDSVEVMECLSMPKA